MEEMADADPANASRIRATAEKRFSNPELVLRALRLSRETLQKEQEARERRQQQEQKAP